MDAKDYWQSKRVCVNITLIKTFRKQLSVKSCSVNESYEPE